MELRGWLIDLLAATGLSLQPGPNDRAAFNLACGGGFVLVRAALPLRG